MQIYSGDVISLTISKPRNQCSGVFVISGETIGGSLWRRGNAPQKSKIFLVVGGAKQLGCLKPAKRKSHGRKPVVVYCFSVVYFKGFVFFVKILIIRGGYTRMCSPYKNAYKRPFWSNIKA